MDVLLITTLPNSVASALETDAGLNVLDVKGLERENLFALIADAEFDVLLTYRCPYIIPPELYNKARFGAFNIHPSLLPAYKGLNPWEEIFRNHETVSGVTIHRLSAEPDSGEILIQKPFEIRPDDSIETARAKADELAGRMVRDMFCTVGK